MTKDLKNSKTLNVILYITQVILALTFIWAGFMKLYNPSELPWKWIKENPNLVTITGILDLLAGFGFVLPGSLFKKYKNVVIASAGTIFLMISACIFHIMRGEASDIGFNIFVLILSSFILWGRSKK